MTKHITVIISDEEEAHLRAMAEHEATTADEIISSLLQQQMDYDAWFRRKVQAGIDQADAGKLIPHEEVVDRMRALRTELLARKPAE